MKIKGLEQYQTDPNLEHGEGVRIEYGEKEGDFWVVIHRAGGSNRAFARVLSVKMKPHERKRQMGVLSEEVADQIMMETYAETIVKNWGGDKCVDESGTPIPFTRDNVVSAFIDNRDFYAAVQRDANDLAIFRLEQRKINEGNSDGSSGGA